MQNFAFAAIVLLLTKAAWAACPMMSLSNVNSYVSLNANNFVSLEVKVNKGSGSCGNFFVAIDNGGASSFSTRTIQSNMQTFPIQFYKNAARNQILKSEFEATPAEVLFGTFDGGTTSFNTVYYAYIDAGSNQYIGSGNYNKNFMLKLYEGDFNNRILRDTKVVQFAFTQYKSIDVSLVSTGSAFNFTDTTQNVDFGKLVEGATRGFDIVLLYNAGYSVSMNSTNNGRMKHSTEKKFVPYSLAVDGIPVALTNVAAVVKSAAGISTPHGTRLPVTVKIGSLTDSAPGTYTDTVMVNVSSVE